MTNKNSKPVMTVALLATLLLTGVACSGNKPIAPSQDLTKMTALTQEVELNAEDIEAVNRAAAQAPAVGPTQTTSTPHVQRDTPSTVPGLDEVISLGKYMGPQGAMASRVFKAIWKLIEKNQAVVNLSSQNLSLLPDNANARAQLAGFQLAQPRKFRATLKNLYGIEVVRYDYLISYYHSGNVKGRGRYIANLNVSHSHVKVLPGFRLDAEFVTGNLVNAGKSAQDPVVAMPGEVRWKVKNVLTNIRKSNAFYVFGDGRMKVVSPDTEVRTLY